MNSLTTFSQPVLSMTSREVAELVNSRHDKEKPRLGYIYLIESSCGKLVKIGRSKSPSKRLKAINAMSGGVGKTFVSGMVTDSYAVESALHSAFNEFRKTGEWFSIDFAIALPFIDEVCALFPASSNDKARKKKFDKEVADRIKKRLFCDETLPLPNHDFADALQLAADQQRQIDPLFADALQICSNLERLIIMQQAKLAYQKAKLDVMQAKKPTILRADDMLAHVTGVTQ